jgi:hypothetical protein
MVDLKRRGFFAAAAVPVAALPVAAEPVVEMVEADVAMVPPVVRSGRLSKLQQAYKDEFIRQFGQRSIALKQGRV